MKIRQDKQIINKAIYLALGVNLNGKKELLGMWLSENEGAKFWLGVLTELQNRGVQDILIACVDGLKGFPDAINTVYPKAQVQLCIEPPRDCRRLNILREYNDENTTLHPRD